MNTRLVLIPLLLIAFLVSPAQARDNKLLLPVEAAMSTPEAQEQLNKGIKFVFNKNGAKPKQTYGTFTANRKTNAFNKSDEEACNWVFLSALMALQDRAVNEGGDAVVDIHSYYKKEEMRSDDKYECHAGAFVAGVALRGTVVKLK